MVHSTKHEEYALAWVVIWRFLEFIKPIFESKSYQVTNTTIYSKTNCEGCNFLITLNDFVYTMARLF